MLFDNPVLLQLKRQSEEARKAAGLPPLEEENDSIRKKKDSRGSEKKALRKNDDTKEAIRCHIIPDVDSFDTYFNVLFNPDNLINYGEYEYQNSSNGSKGAVNLSSENETVQNIRSNDYYKKGDD